MALKRPTFEASDVDTETGEVIESPAQAPASAPAVVQTQQVALPAKTSSGIRLTVSGQGKGFKKALAQFENAIDPTTLEFNTLNRVTVGLDGFSDEREVDLGKKIAMEMLSYNERFVVTTGAQNDKEADKLVKFSPDGKVTEDGTDVNEYIAYLKEQGYDKAAKKKYLALIGFLVYKDGNEIEPEDREIISVQIPPMSVALFTRYQMTHGVKVSQGVAEDSPILFLTQEKVKGDKTNYASINFSSKP